MSVAVHTRDDFRAEHRVAIVLLAGLVLPLAAQRAVGLVVDPSLRTVPPDLQDGTRGLEQQTPNKSNQYAINSTNAALVMLRSSITILLYSLARACPPSVPARAVAQVGGGRPRCADPLNHP